MIYNKKEANDTDLMKPVSVVITSPGVTILDNSSTILLSCLALLLDAICTRLFSIDQGNVFLSVCLDAYA